MGALTTVETIIANTMSAGSSALNAFQSHITTAQSTYLAETNAPVVAGPADIPIPAPSKPSVDIPATANTTLWDTYNTKYLELVALLVDKHSAFRTAFFPNEQVAYAAVEDWLEARLAENFPAGTPLGAIAVASLPVISVSDAEVEALYGVAEASALTEATRASEAVVAQFAARRFPLPPGAAVNAVLHIQTKAQDTLAEAGRALVAQLVEIRKFNTEVSKFNAQLELDVDKANVEVEKFNAQLNTDLKKHISEQLIKLRDVAMQSAAEYIKALASGPDMASRLVGVGYDAQSKLISAAADYYRADVAAAEVVNKAHQYNAALNMDVEVKNQASELAMITEKVKALLAEAGALAQVAAATYNNLHAQATVSYGADNNVNFSYQNDTSSAPPATVHFE